MATRGSGWPARPSAKAWRGRLVRPEPEAAEPAQGDRRSWYGRGRARSSVAEQGTFNPRVLGSNPSGPSGPSVAAAHQRQLDQAWLLSASSQLALAVTAKSFVVVRGQQNPCPAAAHVQAFSEPWSGEGPDEARSTAHELTRLGQEGFMQAGRRHIDAKNLRRRSALAFALVTALAAPVSPVAARPAGARPIPPWCPTI